EAWENFASYKKVLEDELNRRAWVDTLPRFALRPAALDRGRYIRFGEFLKEQGVVETLPDLDSYLAEIE
ncbi:MAG: ABC transporter ATP-binding protein, partial [Kiloniellales bacterium]|nr:ABC transporter ATP-binding protein [Kiloniellales bacterium]